MMYWFHHFVPPYPHFSQNPDISEQLIIFPHLVVRIKSEFFITLYFRVIFVKRLYLFTAALQCYNVLHIIGNAIFRVLNG